MITTVIFDLAARPEHIQMLREEVNEVLNEFDGEWNPESMSMLKKMDGGVKESKRYGGAAIASFQRKAVKDLTFLMATSYQLGLSSWHYL
jgi:hypothetical protein